MTNTLIYKENDKYGIINVQGEFLIEPKYEKIKYIFQDRYAVLENNLWAIIDDEGRFLTDFKYKDVSNYINDRSEVQLNYRNIKKVLIDLSGNEIEMEYKYDIIEGNMRYHNILPTYTKDRFIAHFSETFFLIDENGKFVDGQMYKKLSKINENLFLAKKYENYTIIDENQNIILSVPKKYSDIYYQMENGMYQVTTESNHAGYIDSRGNEVIPPTYFAGYEFSSDTDLAFVSVTEEKGGYINSKNEFVIEPIYDFGRIFENGIAGVLKDDVWFFINEKGEKISDDYSHIDYFINGYCIVTLLDGSKVVVDNNADVMFTFPEDINIGYFVNELAPITQEGKVGLINIKGEILIEPRFEEILVSKFTSIHRFKENGLYGFVSEEGEIIFEARFDSAVNFGKYGTTIVNEDGVSYLIKDFGESIFKIDLNVDGELNASGFEDSKFAAIKVDDDMYIYMDTDGKVAKHIFEYASPYYNGQAIVRFTEPYEIIDKNGNVVNILSSEVSMEDGQILLDGGYVIDPENLE